MKDLGGTAGRGGLVLLAAWVGFGPGCATFGTRIPAPSATEFASAESAVKQARVTAGDEDGAVGQHLRMADKELAEAKERASTGDSRSAEMCLARAVADADLSQVLQHRERALADAEVLEKQLVETRSSQPAQTPQAAPDTERPAQSAGDEPSGPGGPDRAGASLEPATPGNPTAPATSPAAPAP